MLTCDQINALFAAALVTAQGLPRDDPNRERLRDAMIALKTMEKDQYVKQS